VLNQSEPGGNVQYRVDTDAAVWKIIDGEAVVVHADSSEYFGLNASATALWEVLASSAPSTEELAALLVEQFDREPTTALVEATAFIERSRDAGLLAEITDAPAGGPGPAEVDQPGGAVTTRLRSGPYEPPTLVKFGDLDALVLSGE
jgi:hypothetical protein